MCQLLAERSCSGRAERRSTSAAAPVPAEQECLPHPVSSPNRGCHVIVLVKLRYRVSDNLQRSPQRLDARETVSRSQSSRMACRYSFTARVGGRGSRSSRSHSRQLMTARDWHTSARHPRSQLVEPPHDTVCGVSGPERFSGGGQRGRGPFEFGGGGDGPCRSVPSTVLPHIVGAVNDP